MGNAASVQQWLVLEVIRSPLFDLIQVNIYSPVLHRARRGRKHGTCPQSWRGDGCVRCSSSVSCLGCVFVRWRCAFSDFSLSLLLLCPTRGAAVRRLWWCNDTGAMVSMLLRLSSSLFRPLKELTPVSLKP